MVRPPPISTRTYPLFPYPARFRSPRHGDGVLQADDPPAPEDRPARDGEAARHGAGTPALPQAAQLFRDGVPVGRAPAAHPSRQAPLDLLHQGGDGGADDQGIAQRAAEDLRFDLEDVDRLGPDAVGYAQGGGAEVGDGQAPGTEVLRVLEIERTHGRGR